MVFQDNLTKIITVLPMVTKRSSMVTYLKKRFLPIKLHGSLVLWSFKIT